MGHCLTQHRLCLVDVVGDAGANAVADEEINGFGEAAAMEKLRQEITAAHGVRVAFSGADLSKRADATGLIEHATRELGRVDVLVNNAGIQHVAPVHEFPIGRWDAVIAINSFAPAVGPDTAIVALLNGIRHLDVLRARFGAAHVLGGQCVISTTLDPEGRIVHLGDAHALTFGELDGSASARIETIGSELSGARIEARPTNAILQEMWEKWAFIAASARITCLMLAAIGDIVAAGAADLAASR
jgi:NAD(P)-dependent dehydrogenase (short-subunit alcohol dehydrogenase family)